MPDSDHQESPFRTVMRVIFKTTVLFVVFVVCTIVDNILRWMKVRKGPVEESPSNVTQETKGAVIQESSNDDLTPQLKEKTEKPSRRVGRTEKS